MERGDNQSVIVTIIRGHRLKILLVTEVFGPQIRTSSITSLISWPR